MQIRTAGISRGTTWPLYLLLTDEGDLICIHARPPYPILWSGKFDPRIHRDLRFQPVDPDELPEEVRQKLGGNNGAHRPKKRR